MHELHYSTRSVFSMLTNVGLVSGVSPKWCPHVLINPLKPFLVRLSCVVIIHKNIKIMKCGVDLSLDIRWCCVVVSRFKFNEGMP